MRKLFLVAIVTAMFAAAAAAYAAPPPEGPPGLAKALAAQVKHNPQLLTTPGVVGTAVGLRGDGTAVVKVFAERPGVAHLPAFLDGVPVVVQVTGQLVALGAKPPSKPNIAPVVDITSAANGARFYSGDSVRFAGAPIDKEEGNLSARLIWPFSIDDRLGTAPGAHAFALTVTETAGNSTTRSASFSVTEASPLSITTTVPTGGESWPSGSTQQLGWTVSPAVDAGQFGVWLRNATTGAYYEAGYYAAVPGQTVYEPSFSTAGIPAGSYTVAVYYRADPTVWVWQTSDESPGTATIAAALTITTTVPTGGESWPTAAPSSSAGRSPRRSTPASSASGSGVPRPAPTTRPATTPPCPDRPSTSRASRRRASRPAATPPPSTTVRIRRSGSGRPPTRAPAQRRSRLP